MNFRCITFLSFLLSTVVASPVIADPWKDESGHGYQKNKHYKQKHKEKHKNKQKREYEYEVEYKVEGHDQGPPPWAPAHGYRRKHHHDHERTEIIVNVPTQQEDRYVEHDSPHVEFGLASQKIGITSGTCNRETIGAVMGGIVGGVIGNKTSSDKNKTIGTLAGAVIGVVLGKELGRSMDKTDAQCTGQALERARDGQAVVWNNPETGHNYSVTPYKTYQQKDGRYCRKYNATIKDGGKAQQYAEIACRNQDGVWERQF